MENPSPGDSTTSRESTPPAGNATPDPNTTPRAGAAPGAASGSAPGADVTADGGAAALGRVARGVLYPARHVEVVETARHDPSPEAARYVELYWHVRWRVDEPHDSKVLSYPSVHLVFEDPEPMIYGVVRDLFVRRLEGEGQVLGVKFHPGCFRPFAGGPVSAFTDRTVPAAEVFGPEVVDVGRRVMAGRETADLAAPAERFLLDRLPEPDPTAHEVAGMVERITARPDLFRVDQAAEALHVSTRTLQRLFAEYVGVTPKWVMRRARLQEAATRADAGDTVDWAALAADLGYFDQAHLVRDFTATVGVPPARYARSV
ncbi:helix-turn-helix domain-containing protein [Actinomadura oligospora]|uniref:helix-turn-helix domain-containing protein n=1 Tax=Actinomadura oligospora TaxID=111804 RepID=UPI0004B57BE6|nr:helix-turn-helix domain-containing protein [Actinomadura oligospora]